jgi:omega-6 fatty acid desaturase (delta-12 desaturase)
VLIDRLKAQKQAIIGQHAKPDNLKAAIQVLTTLLPLALLWCAAVYVVNVSYWLVAAIALLMSLFVLRVLVLMHECGHGSLFKSAGLNRTFGFLFGVLTGMPQYVWSQHHAFHHANNGNWDKYRGPLSTLSVDEFTALTAPQQRTYERTRTIAIAPLAGFVYLLFNPRFTWIKGSIGLLIHIVRNKLKQPRTSFAAHAATFITRYWNSPKEYWHMFWNNVALLCMWVGMSWLLGPGLFFAVYIASVSLAGGAGIVLFTVQHNFEHSYATDTQRWDYDVGAMEGTSFLVLPAWLNWFTANIAYHHVHHLSAKIPNYCLVACHDQHPEFFNGVTRITWFQIPKALSYMLWDTRAQKIISVAEYRRQSAALQPV